MSIAAVKQTVLYRSKITHFDEDAHRYTKHKSNVVFPGVTSVIDGAGFGDWMRGIDRDTLEIARLKGKAVHMACQYLDEGDLDENIDPAIAPYVEAYATWREQTNFRLRWAEQHMIHPTLSFAGTPDLIGEIGGRLALIDIKTSTTLSKSVALQLAGYVDLIDAATERPRRFALQLKDNGKARMHEYSVTDLLTRDIPAWRAALTIWRYRNDVRTNTSAAA